MNDLVDALIDFTTADARLEISCLFHKVHAGRHGLGLQTSQLVEEMDRAAQTAYQTFLQDRRGAGDWYGAVSTDVAVKYLGEQIALALAQIRRLILSTRSARSSLRSGSCVFQFI